MVKYSTSNDMQLKGLQHQNAIHKDALLVTTIFAIDMVVPFHDDVIKWKHFPRYWPFVRWIHRSPVNSPHKGQWRGAFMFSFIYAWINAWVNNREAVDLRRHRAHNDVTVMHIMIMNLTIPSAEDVHKWCNDIIRRSIDHKGMFITKHFLTLWFRINRFLR